MNISFLKEWINNQTLKRPEVFTEILPVGFQRLHRIIRWNAIVPKGLERSVLEHSFSVASMARNIGLDHIDIKKAILHDALEMYSGDVQTVFKKHIINYNEIELAFFKENKESIKASFLDVPDYIYTETWEGSTGLILKFLDHFDGYLELEEMADYGVWSDEFDNYMYFLKNQYPWASDRFNAYDRTDYIGGEECCTD